MSGHGLDRLTGTGEQADGRASRRARRGRERQAEAEVRAFAPGHGFYHDVGAAARLVAGGSPANRAERRAAARAGRKHGRQQ